jgi:hypothetical protein
MNKLISLYRGYSICQELITERGKYRDRILGNNVRPGKLIVHNNIITESTKFNSIAEAQQHIDGILS